MTAVAMSVGLGDIRTVGDWVQTARYVRHLPLAMTLPLTFEDVGAIIFPYSARWPWSVCWNR